MMDWLSRPLPDFWAGIGLVAVGVIWFVLGTACIPAGYRECGRPALPRWNPRRWIAPCFSWWLGWSLLGSCIIIGYVGVAVLTDDRDAPLWGLVLCIGTALSGLMTFKFWAAERLPERGL